MFTLFMIFAWFTAGWLSIALFHALWSRILDKKEFNEVRMDNCPGLCILFTVLFPASIPLFIFGTIGLVCEKDAVKNYIRKLYGLFNKREN